MLNVPRFDKAMCGSTDVAHAYWNCNACLSARDEAWAQRRIKQHWERLAHVMVKNAKRIGILPVLDGTIACFDCSSPAQEYDHRDYSMPLQVDPVCHSCNVRRGPAKWPTPDDFKFGIVATNTSEAAA